NGARGALDAGLLPGLLPGGRRATDAGPVASVWRHLPENPGLDTRGMLEAAAAGDIKALYLVGVDPVRDFEDPRLARAALERVDTLVVQDLLPTETTRYADVILPAAAPQERVGSFTTWEGRRQPFPAAVAPEGLVDTDTDIVRQLARAMGTDLGWETAADVRREAAPLMEVPVRATERLRLALPDAAPAGDTESRIGQDSLTDPATEQLDVVVMDHLIGDGSMLLGAKALQETARPAAAWVNAVDAERLGLADGQQVAVVGDEERIELPATITPHVAPGVVVLPGSSSGVNAATLVAAGEPLRVRLEPARSGDADPAETEQEGSG
ncbi:MAG: molybdopterin-dependent oxidoreductase, partial [Egibacteraceae bacterium]